MQFYKDKELLIIIIIIAYWFAGLDPDTFFSSHNREVNNDASEPVEGEPLQYSYGRGVTY